VRYSFKNRHISQLIAPLVGKHFFKAFFILYICLQTDSFLNVFFSLLQSIEKFYTIVDVRGIVIL